MIPVLSVKHIREIDRATIESDANRGYSLMKQAAEGIADTVLKRIPDKNCKIAIMCGKGNNGGDGYAAGWMLKSAGYDVTCFSACRTNELFGEALCAFNEYTQKDGVTVQITDASEISHLSDYALIIDALLGNGLKGDVKGIYADLINSINNACVPVIAADTPSGLDNDTGLPMGACVNATATVTMGYPKYGFYFYPGRRLAGEIIIRQLDYRKDAFDRNNDDVWLPEKGDLCRMLPARHEAGSKGDHGRALLVCGSRTMAGAATLACRSAMRSGCGMTFLAMPGSMTDVMAVKLTETVLCPVAENENGEIGTEAAEQILKLTKEMNSVCVGPGLGHSQQTSGCICEIYSKIDKPLVLDADGLNAFRGCEDMLRHHSSDVVITPHAGEWTRLFGELEAEPLKRMDQMKRVAQEYGFTVLLKGSPTIVADCNGKVFILPYGNSALAKAGSGDVLSGCIVSLAAQGAKLPDAAILGAYIHGEAGREASVQLTEYSVTASDVTDLIPNTIKNLLWYAVDK